MNKLRGILVILLLAGVAAGAAPSAWAQIAWSDANCYFDGSVVHGYGSVSVGYEMAYYYNTSVALVMYGPSNNIVAAQTNYTNGYSHAIDNVQYSPVEGGPYFVRVYLDVEIYFVDQCGYVDIYGFNHSYIEPVTAWEYLAVQEWQPMYCITFCCRQLAEIDSIEYVYPQRYMNELSGAVVDHDSVNSETGAITNPTLSIEAYNYLQSVGLVGPGVTWLTWEIPVVGPVVFAVTVAVLAYEGVQAVRTWNMSRGDRDPAASKNWPVSIAGTKDPNGNCMEQPGSPPKRGVKWYQWDSGKGWHRHYQKCNLNQAECRWYLGNRQESLTDPGAEYDLILGEW